MINDAERIVDCGTRSTKIKKICALPPPQPHISIFIYEKIVEQQ